MSYALTAIVTTSTAAVLTWALVAFLPRVGLVDRSNARSSHVGIVPRGGGLAVLVATSTGVAVTGAWTAQVVGHVVLAWCVGALGFVDDLRGLPTGVRLAVLSVMAGAVAMVLAISGISWPIALGCGFLWVATVNAFNFMDGINAISALVLSVTAAWCAYQGPTSARALAVSVAGAALGFLVLNLSGRIFLGDVGSYAAGSLAWSLVVLTGETTSRPLQAVAPLVLYAVETSVAICVVVALGRRAGTPHRLHAYQRLTDCGASHVVVALYAAAVVGLICVASTIAAAHAVVSISIMLALAGAFVLTPNVVKSWRPEQ